jgi:hypothetical protein
MGEQEDGEGEEKEKGNACKILSSSHQKEERGQRE